MSKEKKAELKIKVPERWLNFIEEYYSLVDRDRDEDLQSNMEATLEMFIEDLDAKDRIRLVQKYQLSDIYKISQWIRDEAAGIPRKPEPIPQNNTAKESQVSEVLTSVLGDFLVREIWKFLKDATPKDIERIKAMTPEELEARLKKPVAAPCAG